MRSLRRKRRFGAACWRRQSGLAIGATAERRSKPGDGRVLAPRVRTLLDQTLALPDEADSGTPAILGRYFDWLLILDRAWVEANTEAMLGAAASAQRKALIWEGHLLHGRSTLLTWIISRRSCKTKSSGSTSRATTMTGAANSSSSCFFTSTIGV